jgi:hypothetical protein
VPDQGLDERRDGDGARQIDVGWKGKEKRGKRKTLKKGKEN